jgi:hypothetical protein
MSETGNGRKPTSLPPQPGCWIVAPLRPHELHRARCLSRSLDVSLAALAPEPDPRRGALQVADSCPRLGRNARPCGFACTTARDMPGTPSRISAPDHGARGAIQDGDRVSAAASRHVLIERICVHDRKDSPGYSYRLPSKPKHQYSGPVRAAVLATRLAAGADRVRKPGNHWLSRKRTSNIISAMTLTWEFSLVGARVG